MTRRPHLPSPSIALATDDARADLRAFDAAQRPNYFESDHQLKRLLVRSLGPEEFYRNSSHFHEFGAIVATTLDEAARLSNEVGNLPQLERWSAFGDRLEGIRNHPAYDVCGRAIYQDGEVIAAYANPASNVRALALFYLSSHAGEAGHNCPVACTAGVVKALRAKGSEALGEKYLPGLLTKNYPDRLDGAQFMTELQGGSDVGKNGVVASRDRLVPDEFGATRWRISGEKWFCSNAEADLILMTARYSVDKAGTSGLGLFLVPRVIPPDADDPQAGGLNGFRLRRLKDKLGTRSMPSAEIDFDGAIAYAVGPVEQGFKTMMTQVIQTSRVYNSFAVAANARRARLIAQSYARHRHAFGTPIIAFPLVQLLLAECRALGHSCLAAAMYLAGMLDADETRGLTHDERAFFRVAANLTKMRSSQHSHRAIMCGIETLGGNGAIESFSILPRLIRDNIVCENWEGTHNTLIAQTIRDLGVAGLGPGFFRHLTQLTETALRGLGSGRVAAILGSAVTELTEAVVGLATVSDPGIAAYQLKPHAERLADLFFALTWAIDLSGEPDETRKTAEMAALSVFVDLYVRAARAHPDAETLALVTTLTC